MPLVTMPREMGTLGKDVAAAVALHMGKSLIHHEIVENIANKMRLRQSHVVRFLEGKASLLDKMTTDETSLSIYTADEIFRLAESGNVGVIRGWGATHLLDSVPHVLHVRVCAPEDTRIRRMMTRLDSSDRGAVEKEIRSADETLTTIARRHFNINWKDAEHYDLVLNTGRVGVDECAAAILHMLKQPAFQETADSAQKLRDLALQARVRAALRQDTRTKKLNITVRSAAGHVTLVGVIENDVEHKSATEVTATVPGVGKVTNNLKGERREFRRMGG